MFHLIVQFCYVHDNNNKKKKTKTEILLHKANMFYTFMCVCVRLGTDRVLIIFLFTAQLCRCYLCQT